MTCNCKREAETGRESIYGWLYAGCRSCGIYVSAWSEDELANQWARRQQTNIVGAAWWESWYSD